MITAGAVLIISGLVVGLSGIPVSVYGGKKVMSSSGTANVFFGVGRIGFEGTF